MVDAPTSDGQPRPNAPTPQATKPSAHNPYGSIGLGARNNAVVSVCTYVNQILTYAGKPNISLPAQSNTDERMPLTFLRPAITALNGLNASGVTAMPVPAWSLDFNAFTSFINRIITQANAVNAALP